MPIRTVGHEQREEEIRIRVEQELHDHGMPVTNGTMAAACEGLFAAWEQDPDRSPEKVRWVLTLSRMLERYLLLAQQDGTLLRD